jgi:DNA-binding protein YbaB
MTAAGCDLRLMQQQSGELDTRLAAARYTARSDDQLVTAVATGQGALLDLRIEDKALTGAHTHKLGLSIVEAVRAARAAASAGALPQLNALFGKQPPASSPSKPLQLDQRVTQFIVRRVQRHREADLHLLVRQLPNRRRQPHRRHRHERCPIPRPPGAGSVIRDPADGLHNSDKVC